MATMDKLIINVCGPSGSGKSTIIRLLSEALEQAGIDDVKINVLDPDVSRFQKLRLAAIALKVANRKTEIEINEVQRNRLG